MTDTLINMMSMLTMFHKDDERTRGLAIETALSHPKNLNAETLIGSLIRDRLLPAEYLHAVLHANSASVRRTAWTEYAHTLPIELWNTLGHREDDDDVLVPLRRIAPLQRMSPDGVAALYDIRTTKPLTRVEARSVVEHDFRPGMEDLWRRALVNLPPDRVPDAVVRKAYMPVIEGHVADLLPGTPALYRVAAACAMRAEPGTLTALVAAEPNIGLELGAAFESAAELFRTRLRECLVNRYDDLMALHDLRVANHHYSLSPLLRQERDALEGTPDQHLLAMSDGASPTPQAYHYAWDRLDDEHRTDIVCAYLLDGDVGHPLHVKIVEWLGDRALEVVQQHKLTDLARYSDPKKWWPLVDLGAWVGAMRYASLAGMRQHLDGVDETLLKYLAADLLADPTRWQDTAAAGVAIAAGFGHDEVLQLTSAQVVQVGYEYPAARSWIADALVDAEHLHAPAVREGVTVMADSTARFVDVLAAAKSLT